MKTTDSKFLSWLGFLLLAAAFLYALFVLSAKRTIDGAVAAIEAEGRPVSLDELIPEEIPAGENAALVYDAVVRGLQGDREEGEDRFAKLAEAAREALKDDAGPDALEKFRALYESGALAEALAVLEEASHKGFRRDLDYSQGIHLALPHLQGLQGLSWILAATARLQAAEGDHAAAMATALTTLRLARSLENEPILISQLVRAAIFQNAVESLQALDFRSAAVPMSPDTRELLRSFEDPAPFVAAIDMERIIISDAMSNYKWSDLANQSSDESIGSRVLLGAYQVLPPLRARDRAAHMKIMGSYARNLEAPYSPDDREGLAKELLADVPPFAIMTRAVTPGFNSIKSKMAGMAAESRVTQTGLSILEHHQQTGSYPPDLSVISGAIPVDPFTGKPLVYRPEANGFTLHSLGNDLGDDGGTVGQKREPGDIVWRYVERE